MEARLKKVKGRIEKLENAKKKLKLQLAEIREKQAGIKAEIEPLRAELRACEKLAALSESERDALRDVLGSGVKSEVPS